MRYGLHVRETVDSTQQVLLDGAKTWQDRASVVTNHQSAGRGRRGRAWQSPPGSSLALSMLARSPEGGRWAMGVSLALGVAAAQALHGLGATQVRLKWPNDLVVDGCKLGGILVETCAGGIVAGIGINLALPVAVRQTIGQPCIDLAQLGCDATGQELAAALIVAWNEVLDAFLALGLAAFLPHWQALDVLHQRPVRVLSGAQIIEGVACGIDAQGCLQVSVAGQQRSFSSAEVSVRPQ